MKIFIIGNGESRKQFDLSSLRGKGPIFGCNALYRDFDPDYLVSLDRPMVDEITQTFGTDKLITTKLAMPLQKAKQDNPGSLKRDRLALLNNEVITSLEVPCFNSGMFATYVACKMYPYLTDVYLLGFDFHNEESNIYHNTPNYNQSLVRFHSDQWKAIFSFFSSNNFTRVGDSNSEFYTQLGIDSISYANFIDYL